mgnify:CR=1 FL=1
MDCTHECGEDQFSGMVGVGRQADDLSCKQVKCCGNIHLLPPKGQVGEVCHPDMVFILRKIREEQVWVSNLDSLGSCPFLAMPAVGLDAKDIHHSLHAFSVQSEAGCNPS